MRQGETEDGERYMGTVIIAFVAFVAIMTLFAYVASRWMSDVVQRHISGRLDALDEIVNEEKVPESWLHSFRRRAARMRKLGASQAKVDRLKEKTRKRSLGRIQELQRYVEGSGVADTAETKEFILEALQVQEERWRDDAAWDELVASHMRPPECDTSAPTSPPPAESGQP